MTTTTSAEQVHATRAEQRRLRLLEAEREQAEEDAQALLITEEQREMLLRPFRGVKAEFQDLDGFRWTEAQLEAHMRGMRSNNNLPHHHHQAAIGAAMGGEGGEGGSDEGGEGEGGGEDDTIRVRARVGEEEGSGETPLGARRHRDGSKARSPVKGLFPPSSPLALAPPALPRPPGLAPAPAYTPYDDATLTRRAGKKRGHESAPGLRLTSPSSRPPVRGPRSAPASGSSLPSGLTAPSPSPFPAAAAGPSTTARDATGQSARARLAALLEHSHALPSYGRQPSSSASAIPPPSPEQTRHPPRTHPALGHPLTRHPSHAPSLRQTRSATSAIPPSPLPSPSPSPSPSPLPTPAPSSPLSHAHSRAPRSGSTSAHPAFRSAYRGSTSTYLPPSSTSLPLSVAYTPLSSSSSSVADATARAAASVSPPSSRAHTHGRAQLSADAPTTHPRPRINPDAHSSGYPPTTARIALTPNVAGLRGWRGDAESALDDDEPLDDEEEILDDVDDEEDDEEGWCRGCDDVACEDCDDDDEDEECDEDEDCDDDEDCDEECDDDDEDEDEDEIGRGDGDREVLYDDYEHAREGPVVRLPLSGVARGRGRGALRAPVAAEDGRDIARSDGERVGGSRGRERLLSTRTIRPLPTRVDARVMVLLDNSVGAGVGAGVQADGEDEDEGVPGERGPHDATPTPTPTPRAAVGEGDTHSPARALGRALGRDEALDDTRSTMYSENRSTTARSRSRSRSRSRPPTLLLPPGLPTLSPLQTLPAHAQGHAGARRVYEPEDGEVTPRPA